MKHTFCFLLLLIGLPVSAQDVRDLVRFSETQVFGSARFEAMAGSFGALGADLSTSSINPAGYGRYSSSAIGLSFQQTQILNKVTFNTKLTETKLNSFKLNNIGVVFTNDISQRNRGFLFQQFGFSYNRIQNFKDQFSYSGEQFYSLLDNMCSKAAGLSVDEIYSYLPFSSALAWDTYAIDPDGQGGYVPRLENTNMVHQRTVVTSGGMSEYNFNWSGNYMNKLYIGANIGLRTAKYQEDYYHHEEAISNPSYSLDSFDYEYHLTSKGSGTNFKLGVIYLPKESIRLGLSLHSNSYFEFTDNFDADMTSYHKDTTYRIIEEYKPVGNYKYRLRTPAKAVASFAYIFGTRGCINIDAELVNYKGAQLRTTKDPSYTPYDYEFENKEAEEQLRTVVNLRVGGELVFNSQYFIRGGFALYPSAYNQQVNPAKGTQVLSGGLGFKLRNMAFDLALKISHRNYNYYAFDNSLTTVKSFKNGVIFNFALNF